MKLNRKMQKQQDKKRFNQISLKNEKILINLVRSKAGQIDGQTIGIGVPKQANNPPPGVAEFNGTAAELRR